MKNIILLLVAIIIAANTNAQEKGVKFETCTLEQAIVKAKKSKKLVFVDCYTKWCGPCQIMLKTIFPQEKAGKFFNSKFVNVKIDMEVGEGVELNKKFNITGYPTFIILDGHGKEIARLNGANSQLEAFIERVEYALNPENSLDTLQKRYESNKCIQTGMPYLKALHAVRMPIDSLVSELYFSNNLIDRFNPDLFEIACSTIKTLDNPLFIDICINKKDGDAVLGEKVVTDKIKILYTDILQKYIARNPNSVIDNQLITNAAINIGFLNIPNDDPVAHIGKIALLVSKRDFDAVANYAINHLVDVTYCRNKKALEGALSVCMMNETNERKMKLKEYYEKVGDKSSSEIKRYKRMGDNLRIRKQ